MTNLAPARIEKIIYVIRKQKVMLDVDLAQLFEIETKKFNQAVKRNINRFPSDFMFQLTKKEHEILRSQIVTSSLDHGGRRYRPFAFTEQGIAMLSSVLTSERAVEVNISIIRTFVKLRQFLAADEMLVERLVEFENGTNKLFTIVFDRLNSLEADIPLLPEKRKRIGLKEKI